VRPFMQLAREAEPIEDQRLGPVRRQLALRRSAAVYALLDANDWLITRLQPDVPPRWERGEVAWADELEAAYPEIREELLAWVAETKPMPRVAELSGLDAESEVGRKLSSSDQGQFRLTLLYQNGRWVPEVRERFPRTAELIQRVPRLMNAGFTALDAGSHLRAHVDPKGGYRYHLPVVVPGAPGDCRIRIQDEVIPWTEGEGLLFNESAEHEVWNESDGTRVMFVLGARIPLRFPCSALNYLAQRWYRYHPALHRMPDRASAYAREAMATA
jgi:aspartyl/asparaginyl beta-hydroxylase (cupin superfamily)